jgi:hypothetical protein
MFPRAPSFDSPYGGTMHVEMLRNAIDVTDIVKNFNRFFFGKLRHWVFFAFSTFNNTFWPAPFSYAISYVIALCAEKQMFRISTRWIIAGVAYKQAANNFALIFSKRKNMGSYMNSASVSQISVLSFLPRTSPAPTTCRSSYHASFILALYRAYFQIGTFWKNVSAYGAGRKGLFEYSGHMSLLLHCAYSSPKRGT